MQHSCRNGLPCRCAKSRWNLLTKLEEEQLRLHSHITTAASGRRIAKQLPWEHHADSDWDSVLGSSKGPMVSPPCGRCRIRGTWAKRKKANSNSKEMESHVDCKVPESGGRQRTFMGVSVCQRRKASETIWYPMRKKYTWKCICQGERWSTTPHPANQSYLLS